MVIKKKIALLLFFIIITGCGFNDFELNDVIEGYTFYPIEIGNKWKYKVNYDEGQGDIEYEYFLVSTITKDTVIYYNRYFVLEHKIDSLYIINNPFNVDIHPQHNSGVEFLRMDSSSSCLYKYDPRRNTEILFRNFSLPSGTNIKNDTYELEVEVKEIKWFGKNYRAKIFMIGSAWNIVEFTYLKNLGPNISPREHQYPVRIRTELIGAKINDKLLGDFHR